MDRGAVDVLFLLSLSPVWPACGSDDASADEAASTSDAPAELDAACEAYGDNLGTCYGRQGAMPPSAYVMECLSYGEELGQMHGDDCVAAYAEVAACLGTLACGELPDYHRGGRCDALLPDVEDACALSASTPTQAPR